MMQNSQMKMPFRPLSQANSRWTPRSAYETSVLPQGASDPYSFPSQPKPGPSVSSFTALQRPQSPEKPVAAESSNGDDVQKAPEEIEVAELDDLDEEDDAVGKKESGLFRSQPSKEIKLNKFESVFEAQATHGSVTVEQLPAILLAAEVEASDDAIQTIIQRKIIGADDLKTEVTLEQALEIYQELMDEEGDGDPADERSNCCTRWADSMSDTKATNVLLTIVVGVSFISAFLVAGLAILLMIVYSESTMDNQMIEDLGTMRDIMEVFDKNIFFNEVNSRVRELSTLISAVTSYVSYQSVIESDLKNLEYMATFLAQGVAAWWMYQPERAYTDIAKVVALWLDAAMSHKGRTQAFDMVNSMLNGLPAGYEILVGNWTDDTNKSVNFLTDFRFGDQCIGKCGSDASTHGMSPMKAAMSGIDGALRGFDYRPAEVLVGYTSIDNVGVEYKADVKVITDAKYERVREFFDEQNANALDSREFLIGRVAADGSYELLTKLRSCDSSCIKHVCRQEGPLGNALRGNTGTMELIGYFGKPVLAAFCPIPDTNLGLVVQMLKEERVEAILQSVTDIIEMINANLTTGTEELELYAYKTVNGTSALHHLTDYKFPQDCPGGVCANITPYVKAAMVNCSNGVMRSTDYRGKPVAVGYYCLGDLKAYLTMKIDTAQTDEEMLGYAVQLVNERNAKDGQTSDEFLLARRNDGLQTEDVKTFDDFHVLTKIKHPEECLNAQCKWNSHILLRALQDKEGDLPANQKGFNYAGRSVTAALDYDASIGGGIGMAMEKYTSDFMAPVVDTLLKLIFFTLGTVLFATAVLIFFTKKMMKSMITASMEGKKAIEREKQQFQALVASMYPAYVVPHLLAGERHIVAHIKHTAVFFSDIYEFTSASNTITSEELIQFMGYTYGVMDDIAERYKVYKVKTVGDAYLAIAGLPGTDSKEPCLDMLRFASCVAQVFSHRFNHPDKGKILAVVANTMSWNRKKRRAIKASTNEQKSMVSGSNAKSSIAPPSSAMDGHNSAWTGKGGTEIESTLPSEKSKATSSMSRATRSGPPQVQCIMSYGVATGAVTAGVLQGKSPMFDIWGKTVNLASRMESTGQPGRIQVSEHFFRKVATIPGQPFTFEPGHKAYCKGFGAVNSYFVRSTSEPPPKDLMLQLGLEPRFGLFYFDNILNGIQRNTTAVRADPAQASGSVHGNSTTGDEHSESSERSSQRANPHIGMPSRDLGIVDYDDA